MGEKFYLGENAKTFSVSPKFDKIDMVILNLDENYYVSSPSVQLDEEKWEENSSRRGNNKYIFTYDTATGNWKRNGSVADLADCGITVTYSASTDAAKEGDTITVVRFGNSEEDTVEHTIELTRSGRRMEADCPLVKPSARQKIADDLLDKLKKYKYQPFTAGDAEVNPLMELGDGITAHGVYGGMYRQELNFESLMTSNIGAPAEEETDHEYAYETESERKYGRKFADISAEFEIHSNAIEARVTKEGGQNRTFGWRLLDDSWTVFSANKEVFKIDENGAYVRGKITAEEGFIGTENAGFHISSHAIYNGVTAEDEEREISLTNISDRYNSGVYFGTDGIYLGGGKFVATRNGAVTASNLSIDGGSINLGKYTSNDVEDYRFKVTSQGYVTASNLTINGGSINLGKYTENNITKYLFQVTSSGYLYAVNANLSGTLTVGGTQITASALQSGAQSAYNNGSNWSSAYNWTSGNGLYCYTGSGYGYDYNDNENGNRTANALHVNILWVNRFYVPGAGYFHFQWTGSEARLVHG